MDQCRHNVLSSNKLISNYYGMESVNFHTSGETRSRFRAPFASFIHQLESHIEYILIAITINEIQTVQIPRRWLQGNLLSLCSM